MSLNLGQQHALEVLIKFALSKDERFFILEGPAGVGKTFLINQFYEEVKSYFAAHQFLTGDEASDAFMPIQPTATTNPATEHLVISDSQAQTIHSFLELTLKTNYQTGQSELIPRYGSDGPINQPMLIIVDEASYIDDRLLYFMDKRTHPDSKFILMGDDCQLVSPRYRIAPAFTKGYPMFSLTQQMRQDPNSALGNLCLALRNSVKTGFIEPFNLVKGEIEHFTDHEQWFALAQQEMIEPTWLPCDSRILNWRNKNVVSYNSRILTALRGDPRPYSGQNMISNRPVIQGGLNRSRVVVPNNGQVLVKDVVEAHDEGIQGYKVDYYFKNRLYQGFMPTNPQDIKHLRTRGLAEGNKHLVAKALEEWLDFRPVFSSTVDKAQGSTYDRVFINLPDLTACNDFTRVLRMVYTSVSRARQTVYFYGDLNG